MTQPALDRPTPLPEELAQTISATNIPVAPGQIVGGRYLIGSVIGEGGMGVVCAATHVGLGTPVAIKLIRPDLKHDAESVVRFMNEARAAAALKGEHVARVYDVGQLESGEPYLVMEQLEGVGLDAFLAERGPLNAAEAVDIVLQTCDGLAEAHAVSLVHRDVKPANLFLARRPDGQFLLKILDFGISKRLMDGALRGVTNPGRSMGSPWYMSPEQMMNPSQVDQRADVWSLGVLLYELLTNDYPFNGDGVVQVCANVLVAQAPAPSLLRPDIDPRLDAIVLRCLQKRPEDRFDSVISLAEALRPLSSRAANEASALAPTEGLALAVSPDDALPIELEHRVESPRLHDTESSRVRPVATVESFAPVVGQPPARPRWSVAATAFLSLLVGAALSWLGWPYVYAHYGSPDWWRGEHYQLPGDPHLNPGPPAYTPSDRNPPRSELALIRTVNDVPPVVTVVDKARARPAAVPQTPRPAVVDSQPPAYSPEDVRRRLEDYQAWLRAQGISRVPTENAEPAPVPPREPIEDAQPPDPYGLGNEEQ